MIIINPVIAESDTESFLDENFLDPHYRLTNSPFNTRLYTALPHHRIGQKMLAFDLDKGFHVGQVVMIEHLGITILNIGLPISMDEGVSSKIKNGIEKHLGNLDKLGKQTMITWVEDAEGIIHRDALKEAVLSAEYSVEEKSWNEVKSDMKMILLEKATHE